MNRKRALQNMYFEYEEAYRAVTEAKAKYRAKTREIMMVIFRIYEEWCRERYGRVVKPWYWKHDRCEEPVKAFYNELCVYDREFRKWLSRKLHESFDEKYPNWLV